jgi:hypothetical protein
MKTDHKMMQAGACLPRTRPCVAPDADEQDDAPILPSAYGRWIDANHFLPRGYMMPCEVVTDAGYSYFWVSASHDWRGIVRWRQVTLTKGQIRRLRKLGKITAEEIEVQ